MEAIPPIGLVFAGDPHDRWAWSGIPHAILTELQALGHGPTWVDARPQAPLLHAARRALTLALLPAGIALRTGEAPLAAAGRLADAGTANARLLHFAAARDARRGGAPRELVQLRGDLVPVRGSRTVILEDITVKQVAEHRQWVFGPRTPERLTRRRIAHQRRAHERAAASCVASDWAGASLRDDYGIAPHRVHVVGFGAEPLGTGGARDWTVPQLLWIGLDWERKGGSAVLRAFRRLRAEAPAAELHLVGDHPRAAEPGVTGHGRLDRGVPAERARLADLLNRSTALVLPSVLEPFGIVHLEAGLAGLASVGTTAGGAATAIGAGGLLVSPGDEEALAAALRRIADPETAAALGELAREHAGRFTWRKVTERLVRALDPELADARGYAEFVAPGRLEAGT